MHIYRSHITLALPTQCWNKLFRWLQHNIPHYANHTHTHTRAHTHTHTTNMYSSSSLNITHKKPLHCKVSNTGQNYAKYTAKTYSLLSTATTQKYNTFCRVQCTLYTPQNNTIHIAKYTPQNNAMTLQSMHHRTIHTTKYTSQNKTILTHHRKIQYTLQPTHWRLQGCKKCSYAYTT